MSPDTDTEQSVRDPYSAAAVGIQARLTGARAEFEQLMRELGPTLTGFVINQARRLGHRLGGDDVTDVLGEVWVIVWQNFTKREPGFRDDGRANFRGYACAIAQNCLRKVAYPRKRPEPLPDSLPAPDQLPPESVLLLAQTWGDYCWLRDSLPKMDTHLEHLLGMYPAPSGERKRGPRGDRTYTGLLDLHESVRRVLMLKEIGAEGNGANDSPEADDE